MSLPDNVVRTADREMDYATPAAGYGYGDVSFETLPLDQIGAHYEETPPGVASMTLHYHQTEEEQFYVLSGELTVRELVRGADDYREYTLRAGDLVVYPGGTGLAHQFVNRSETPARFLALSDARNANEIAYFPDSDKVMVRALKGVFVVGEGAPEAAFAAARARAAARPVTTSSAPPEHVATRAVERALGPGLFGSQLSRVAGAKALFVNRDRLAPGAGTTLHRHTANEELVWVLEGRPTLHQRDDSGDVRCELRPGDLVHWAAGAPVAHRLLNESDADARVLVVGTDRPEDVILVPDQARAVLEAFGKRGPLQEVGYFDGEVPRHVP